MRSHIHTLVSRNYTRGVLVDTNLMILLVVGTYRVGRIGTFKRTINYAPSDYSLVSRLITPFTKRITTPNILTEVDNLSRQISEEEREPVAIAFSKVAANLVEIYKPSISTIGSDIHTGFGLTDAVTEILSRDYLVLTDDFALSNKLSAIGRDVLNLNHLRL